MSNNQHRLRYCERPANKEEEEKKERADSGKEAWEQSSPRPPFASKGFQNMGHGVRGFYQIDQRVWSLADTDPCDCCRQVQGRRPQASRPIQCTHYPPQMSPWLKLLCLRRTPRTPGTWLHPAPRGQDPCASRCQRSPPTPHRRHRRLPNPRRPCIRNGGWRIANQKTLPYPIQRSARGSPHPSRLCSCRSQL